MTVGLFLLPLTLERDLILIDFLIDRFFLSDISSFHYAGLRAEFPHCLLEGFHVKVEGHILLHRDQYVSTSITRRIIKKAESTENRNYNTPRLICYSERTVETDVKHLS